VQAAGAPERAEVAEGQVLPDRGPGQQRLCGPVGGHGADAEVDGRTVPPGDPRGAVDLGVCTVPADRAAQALLPKATVRENLTLGDLRPFWRTGRLRKRDERRECSRWVERLDVRPPQPEKTVTELSGGNQQKVVMARWLRCTPAVLVLDEPTQGVDIGSKADIHGLVEEATAAGAAVVVCSTDDDELARLATEVVVLRRGRVAVRLTGADITAERIEEEQLRPEAPVVASSAH
jgi:ribose transport system ATP-binding protein